MGFLKRIRGICRCLVPCVRKKKVKAPGIDTTENYTQIMTPGIETTENCMQVKTPGIETTETCKVVNTPGNCKEVSKSVNVEVLVCVSCL
jgi:hypothetical protein